MSTAHQLTAYREPTTLMIFNSINVCRAPHTRWYSRHRGCKMNRRSPCLLGRRLPQRGGGSRRDLEGHIEGLGNASWRALQKDELTLSWVSGYAGLLQVEKQTENVRKRVSVRNPGGMRRNSISGGLRMDLHGRRMRCGRGKRGGGQWQRGG